MKNRFLTTVLGVAVVLLAHSSSASACSCFDPSPVDEAFDKATAVFFAELVDEEPDFEPGYPSGPLPPWYRFPVRELTFRVIVSWKGVSSTNIGLVTSAGGFSCGFYGDIGERYLIYAYENNCQLVVTLCSFWPEHAAALEMAELDSIADRIQLADGPEVICPPVESLLRGLCGNGIILGLLLSLTGLRLLANGRAAPFECTRTMNAVTLAVIEAIERAGAEVQIEIGPDVTEVRATIDGHTHIVCGPDAYKALCLAAEACGVELEDG